MILLIFSISLSFENLSFILWNIDGFFGSSGSFGVSFSFTGFCNSFAMSLSCSSSDIKLLIRSEGYDWRFRFFLISFTLNPSFNDFMNESLNCFLIL